MSVNQWLANHWRVLCAALLFGLVAPVALFAIPVAALLAVSSPGRGREGLTIALAGGFGIAWLLAPGDLPEQLLKAAVVVATAVFVAATRLTRASVTHRAILSTTTAALVTGWLLPAVGSSWGEFRWWVEHRMSQAASIAMQTIWSAGAADSEVSAEQLAGWVDASVQFLANYYPAILALQLMAGLAIASTIYYRVARHPWGPPADRLRDFRFSEHLGWIAVVPLTVVLVPLLGAAHTGALNLLMVVGAMYALRGLAVAVFALQMFASGSGLLVASLAVAALLLLPFALGGAILLGVVDAGLDLRRRWQPPKGE